MFHPPVSKKVIKIWFLFNRFPVEDETILKKWINALGFPKDKTYNPSRDDFVCSKHFDPEDVEDGILKPNAVPLENGKKIKKEISDKVCRSTELVFARCTDSLIS